jgi:hypothetical protein
MRRQLLELFIIVRQETNLHHPDSGQLLALVDALHAGTLNDDQRETLYVSRAGILALAQIPSGARAQAV